MKIAIALTEKCQKGCWFCYAESSPKTESILPFDELKEFIQQLALKDEFGRPSLHFGGGEPFEYPYIVDLIELLETLNYPYSITSNLVYCEPAKLIKTGWLWGSIHFPPEAPVVIEKLQSIGNNVGAIVLVMRKYLETDRLYQVFELLNKQRLPFLVTFFKASGGGKKLPNQEPTKEQKSELLRYLYEMFGKPIASTSCLGIAKNERCPCGKTWFAITPNKVIKTNSFQSVGIQLEKLTIENFLDAIERLPFVDCLKEVT